VNKLLKASGMMPFLFQLSCDAMNMLKSIYIRLIIFKSIIQYQLRHILKTFTLKGIKLSIDEDKVLSKTVLLSVLQGGYEDKENKLIKENLESNDVVLELGAGIGFNSITAAKINGGKIISYESNPYLHPVIKKNQALNNVSFEVREKILLSTRSPVKTIPFKIADNICMSSIKDYVQEGYSVNEVKQVETEFLGDVLASLSPAFLIVDIEGGEEDLFNAPEVLQHSSVKKILVEVHLEIIGKNACATVISNISKAGFDLVSESPDRTVLFFTKSKS